MSEKESYSTEKKDPVASGRVSNSGWQFLRKIGRSFIAEDLQTVAKDVYEDAIVPGIKSLIMEIIGGMLGADVRTSKKKKERTDYGAYSADYKYGSGRRRRDDDDDNDSRFDYRDIIFDTKGEAERVIERLQEQVDEYDQASIADLFDFADMSKYSRWTDRKWGWTNLDSARSRRISGGYELVLPKVKSLEA